MIPLHSDASKEKDFDIDIESGSNAIITEQEGPNSDVFAIGEATNHLPTPWNGFGVFNEDQEVLNLLNEKTSGQRSFGDEEKTSLLANKVENERLKEKVMRKSSKPPRPPKGLSLDVEDQKMVKEISELAMLKRARIERMNSLRRKKNAKAGFNSSNLCALFVTILFCVIIIWHGVSSKGRSAIKAHGSPEPSLLHYGGQYN